MRGYRLCVIQLNVEFWPDNWQKTEAQWYHMNSNHNKGNNLVQYLQVKST